MRYDPDLSLSDLIEIVVENHETEREEFWQAGDDPDSKLSLVDEAGELVMEAADRLVRPERSEFGFVRDLGQAKNLVSDVPFMRHAVEAKIARELAFDIAGKTDRCVELVEYVLDRQPPDPVLQYTQRLSRCYIAGFYPECVMLCRSVLENAVKSVFGEHGIPLPATAEGASPMRTQLDAAVRLGWLSDDGRRKGWTVWQRGNKAVHNDPGVTGDVLATIKMTLDVCAELFPT